MSMASGILYPCTNSTDFQVDSVSISCTGPKTILGRLFYPIRLVSYSFSFITSLRRAIPVLSEPLGLFSLQFSSAEALIFSINAHY